MGSINYKDFELCIEKRGGQRYHAKVLHSPCGEPDIEFKLPFSRLELENFILRIGSARRGVRRINSPEMQIVRDFGSKLFESIFSGDVRACLTSSQNQATSEGIGLRLKLRLEAPDLINIPWEFLYDASHGRFLALFEKTPIVRYIDVLDRTEPLKVELPLAMLVMVSSPEDYPILDVAREKANLEKAIKELISDGLINITLMEQATLPALADHLMRGQYHIFHFIGHGGFDEKNQDGILVMEDEIQRGYFVSGERLAVLLGNQSSLRMVFLNSCEGGRTSSSDPFAGVATTLVRTGSVSAVVAMQMAITDQAAITFARGFYNALSVGRPVDAAVTQARLSIFADSNDVEWGTPVLYMRSPDGLIFDIGTLSQKEREKLRFAAQVIKREIEQHKAENEREEKRQRELADLYERALDDLDGGEWSGAYDLLLRIDQLEPGFRDVADLLNRAKNEKERLEQKTGLINQGKERMDKGEWPQAVLAFQQALSISPDDTEAQELLKEANSQANQQIQRRLKEQHDAQLLSLYNQATSHLNARDWTGALALLEQANQIDPDYRDLPALIEQARVEMSKAQQVSALLAQGKTSLEQNEWSQAAEAFSQALELAPDSAEAKSLLMEANSQANQQIERRRKEEHDAQLMSLYDQASSQLKARDWAEALSRLTQASQLDPDYRDIPALIEQAKTEKSKAEQVVALLAQGKNNLKQKEWSQAAKVLARVLELDPDCDEARSLLVDANAGLKPPPVPTSPVKPPRPTSFPEEIRQSQRPKDLPR